eukprot:TRINITY_DN12899_c0_g1_i1.p3 TRINITY_DN12899_c0_g1~~TRINITY_DN12899_c0_g1_i1.p3  ORF type:complete len:106 (+),score=53.82 TRINITY_DN12899_c0_g1_i1:48-320(+)
MCIRDRDGGMQIGHALKIHQSLINLDISFNTIGDEGCIAIGYALVLNQSLEDLNLSSNEIGDEGTKAISCLLYTSPSPRDQRGARMPSSA